MKITSIKKLFKQQGYELKKGHNYIINVPVRDMPLDTVHTVVSKMKEEINSWGVKNVLFFADPSQDYQGVEVVEIKVK